MVRLLIEILIVMVISSIAFVLGAIFGSSTKGRDLIEARMEELINETEKIEVEDDPDGASVSINQGEVARCNPLFPPGRFL
jgi:hypothetical protein